MSFTRTYSQSQSGTYTEARANYVTGKIFEDLLNLMSTGLITKKRADRAREDLLFLQSKRALKFFEFQFKNSDGSEIGGLHYKLVDGGFIYSDDESGRINFWGLPSNTKVTFFYSIDWDSDNAEEAKEYTKGWGTGNGLTGIKSNLKSYSKDGYGFKQSRIGEW